MNGRRSARGKAQAFPGDATSAWSGLTKREHFAALAMQGILANSARDFPAIEAAHEAVAHADALITALDEADR